VQHVALPPTMRQWSYQETSVDPVISTFMKSIKTDQGCSIKCEQKTDEIIEKKARASEVKYYQVIGRYK